MESNLIYAHLIPRNQLNILNLPNEMLCHIVQYLRFWDKATLAKVCRKFNNIVSYPLYWEKLVKERLKKDPKLKPGESYRKYFARNYAGPNLLANSCHPISDIFREKLYQIYLRCQLDQPFWYEEERIQLHALYYAACFDLEMMIKPLLTRFFPLNNPVLNVNHWRLDHRPKILDFAFRQHSVDVITEIICYMTGYNQNNPSFLPILCTNVKFTTCMNQVTNVNVMHYYPWLTRILIAISYNRRLLNHFLSVIPLQPLLLAIYYQDIRQITFITTFDEAYLARRYYISPLDIALISGSSKMVKIVYELGFESCSEDIYKYWICPRQISEQSCFLSCWM